MPDGATHFKIYLKKRKFVPFIAAAATLSTYGLTKDAYASAAVFIGTLLGYGLGRWFDPDADLLGLSMAEGRLMQELKLVGALIVAWFIPYAYLMRFVGIGRKGHRNIFSHGPIISSLIRLIWLLLIPAIVVGVGWYYWSWSVEIPMLFWWFMGGVWAGLSFADWFHYLADFHSKY